MLTLQPVRGIIRVMKSRQRTRNTKLISLYMTVILSGILIGCNAETGQTEQTEVPQELKEMESYRIPDEILPEAEPNVLVDQIGYETASTKIVLFEGEVLPLTFDVIDQENDEIVYTGTLIENGYDEDWKLNTGYGVFTQLQQEGNYYIRADLIGESYPFTIKSNLFQDLLGDVCFSFYKNRCGQAISNALGGDDAHAACHTAKFTIDEVETDLTGGWHTSIDGSRSVTEGCEAVADLLLAYKLNPEVFETEWEPDSNANEIPGIISEIKYETDWLLKMQDGESGAVYKGILAKSLEGDATGKSSGKMILQNEDVNATAAFAAIMAEFSQVYQRYDEDYARECLNAAEAAWSYISDQDITQAHYFAAACLYNATGKTGFHTFLKEYRSESGRTEENDLVKLRGDVAYLNSQRKVDTELCSKIMKEWMEKVEQLSETSSENAFRVCGTNAEEIFDHLLYLTIINHVITNHEYGTVLRSHLHFFLGRNPEGVSYFGGLGYRHLSDERKADEICTSPKRAAAMLMILGEVVSEEIDNKE